MQAGMCCFRAPMECEPKISVAKACCTQRQQRSQTPDRGSLHVWDACQQQERVKKKTSRMHEHEERNNSSKASGGDQEWQVRKKKLYLCCRFNSVANAPAFPLVCCGGKQRTEGRKEGWRECKNRWREPWRRFRWMDGAKRLHQSTN